jgi:hypothetical protein
MTESRKKEGKGKIRVRLTTGPLALKRKSKKNQARRSEDPDEILNSPL